MKKEVTVVETLRWVEGKREELKRALLQIIPISRKSRGCLQYDLLENGQNEFLVLMRWATVEDLRNHERSQYIDEFVKKYDRVLYDEVKYSVWSLIS